MNGYTAMVVIFAIIAITGMRIARYRFGHGDRSRRPSIHGAVAEAISSATPSPREIELKKEVEALRDRIAVLERIATDANSESQRKSKAIADEIESLRDS